jgi:FdhD protein
MMISEPTVIEAAGVKPAHYIALNGLDSLDIDGYVVEESLACISVNGTEVATFMCSPRDLDKMALGFLYNEGLIRGVDDVRALHMAKNRACVDVWLHDMEFEPPPRAIVTAGCGGGVTFDDLSQQHEPLTSGFTAAPDELSHLMRELQLGATLYQQARGIHTAALAGRGGLLLQMEDIGRHNCLDKLQGAALLAGIDTHDHIVLSSGRISSEMLNKARRMGVPIVCSRTSPTSLSVALADAWNMTIVAYLRQDRMRVYTHPERIMIDHRPTTDSRL